MSLRRSHQRSPHAHHTSRTTDSRCHHPHRGTHHRSTSPLIHSSPRPSYRHNPGRSRNGPSRRHISSRRCMLSDRLHTSTDSAILQKTSSHLGLASSTITALQKSRSSGRLCSGLFMHCQPHSESEVCPSKRGRGCGSVPLPTEFVFVNFQ